VPSMDRPAAGEVVILVGTARRVQAKCGTVDTDQPTADRVATNHRRQLLLPVIEYTEYSDGVAVHPFQGVRGFQWSIKRSGDSTGHCAAAHDPEPAGRAVDRDGIALLRRP
jgi:hypothetical protein